MTFSDLYEWLMSWEELSFWHNEMEYAFINWFKENDGSYWYLLCNQIHLAQKICLFWDNHKLLTFLKNYKIDNKTIQQIFEEKNKKPQ